MYIKTLSIKNFRSLSDIDVEFAPGMNVIVGPNATGKTTVLEAIRLAKALLAQRTNNEAQQTLISLGAASPHNPQQLIASGLVQDPEKPLEVRCGYQLTNAEFAALEAASPQIVTNLVQNRLGGPVNPASFAAFLSSPNGQNAIADASGEVFTGLNKIRQNRVCRLDLYINFKESRVNTPDPIGAALIAFLDQSLPPDKTRFSYFPADRALPSGEVPVQLGAQDAGQQLESHNSQPQLKYGRLKSTIFNTVISGNDGRELLVNEFSKIFSGILKGRELVDAGVGEYGLLRISVRDKDSGRVFDIDGLSSGEKGLVLIFLLIGRTMYSGGVVLLDEPELHLNPAVCKDLLAFMVDNYVITKELQFIVCSHSPEILAGAFGREECSLYHLVSGSLLTKVTQTDAQEVSEALRLLGTSESEGLLYKATIFVEGEHDVEILEAGFGYLLRQYKIKDLGGRNEIEKQIRLLQEAEKAGERIAPRFFIFDHDEAPSQLTSTSQVRVLQWDRRCLENYLLDFDSLASVLKERGVCKVSVRNSGEISVILKRLAMGHLDDAVIKAVYDDYGIANAGRRPDEVAGKEFSEAATLLYDRIDVVKQQLQDFDRVRWTQEFEDKCRKRRETLRPIWDAQWRDLCDGKRLFKELQAELQVHLSLLALKKRVISKMSNHPSTDNWRLIESLLNHLLANHST